MISRLHSSKECEKKAFSAPLATVPLAIAQGCLLFSTRRAQSALKEYLQKCGRMKDWWKRETRVAKNIYASMTQDSEKTHTGTNERCNHRKKNSCMMIKHIIPK